MIITDITPQQKNKNRINLFVDGEFKCGLSSFTVLSSRLKIGQEITDERFNEILKKSEANSCMDIAMKYLGYKPLSRYKMKNYLIDKGFDEDIAKDTVLRLSEMNYLDDAALAKMYVKTYAKKYGNFLIKHKLREMGISSENIDSALPKEETETAIALTEKYLRTHKKDRQKIYMYLSNKGFSSSTIREVIDSISFDGFD